RLLQTRSVCSKRYSRCRIAYLAGGRNAVRHAKSSIPDGPAHALYRQEGQKLGAIQVGADRGWDASTVSCPQAEGPFQGIGDLGTVSGPRRQTGPFNVLFLQSAANK